jgi:hypothetical protein
MTPTKPEPSGVEKARFRVQKMMSARAAKAAGVKGHAKHELLAERFALDVLLSSHDRLTREIERLRGLQTETVSAVQDIRDDLQRRCAQDLPHDHATLRMVEATLVKLDAIHDRAIREAKPE